MLKTDKLHMVKTLGVSVMYCFHQMIPEVNIGLFIFVCEMGNKNPGATSPMSLKLFSFSTT